MLPRSTPTPQPNSNLHAGETFPPLSNAQRKPLAALVPNASLEKFACPHCQHSCLPGTLACPECSVLFAAGRETHLLDVAGEPALKSTPWSLGKVFVEQRRL